MCDGKQLHGELSSIVEDLTSVAADGTELQLLIPNNRVSPPISPLAGGLSQSSDHALIKFTSGSTGVPKGIALSVRNVLAEAQNIVATLGLTADDRVLAPVPLVHSYGFDLGILPMLFSGVSLVVRDNFVPRRLLADLAQKETTVFLGVPNMYRTLVDIPVSSKPDLTHVRYLLSCTAPLHP